MNKHKQYFILFIYLHFGSSVQSETGFQLGPTYNLHKRGIKFIICRKQNSYETRTLLHMRNLDSLGYSLQGRPAFIGQGQSVIRVESAVASSIVSKEICNVAIVVAFHVACKVVSIMQGC